MSDTQGFLLLALLLASLVIFLRALYGLFIWKGRRGIALLQIAATPVVLMIVMLAIVPPPDDDPAETEAEMHVGADSEVPPEETASAPEPEADDAPAQTILGKWCWQERFVESFDRIITIFEDGGGALTARVDFRSSSLEQELTRASDGRFEIAGTREWYDLSDDMANLTLGDEQGEIGTSFAHAEGDDCFRPQGAGAAEAEAQAEEQDSCRNQLSCWAERHFVAASVRCRRAVERSALYTMEWTDGWLETKFSHFRWLSREAGTVTYIGDRARFQNTFGAWQNVIYDCDYDPEAETVLDVRVRPGQLNR